MCRLINAMTDAHVWADTYDRKLTDIFAVESEIAKTIAETLQAKLTGAEQSSITKAPTRESGSVRTLSQRPILLEQADWHGSAQSDRLFYQAIAKDPNYALAYVGLADSYLLLFLIRRCFSGGSLPPARSALKKAPRSSTIR